MPANNESSALDFDDDLPDFSTPEWLEKFDRAPVVYGKPCKAVRPSHHQPRGLFADFTQARRSVPCSRCSQAAAPDLGPIRSHTVLLQCSGLRSGTFTSGRSRVSPAPAWHRPNPLQNRN